MCGHQPEGGVGGNWLLSILDIVCLCLAQVERNSDHLVLRGLMRNCFSVLLEW